MIMETSMNYRKKPVMIQAIQLKWENWAQICEFAGVGEAENNKPHGFNPVPGDSTSLGLRIPTLEGVMEAREGDWIIRGVKGELYPCKPDIFAATYTPADDERGDPPVTPDEVVMLRVSKTDDGSGEFKMVLRFGDGIPKDRALPVMSQAIRALIEGASRLGEAQGMSQEEIAKALFGDDAAE